MNKKIICMILGIFLSFNPIKLNEIDNFQTEIPVVNIYIPDIEFSKLSISPREETENINETYIPTEEELKEDFEMYELTILAQLVQAEAGNQDLTGMRLVVDVVLNRVDDPRFPNTIEEVIFQDNPTQFSVTIDGAFEKAGWDISDDAYLAVKMETQQRLDYGILYFNSGSNLKNGINGWKYGDHWFGY